MKAAHALLLTTLAIAFSPATDAQTFAISGTLVDAQTGEPVNRAHVVLTGAPTGEQSLVTSPDGRFQFAVPAGRYGLFAEKRGYRQTFGNAAPDVGFGSAVITGADHITQNLVFKWFTPGAIFGRVLDDRGDPVENATVQLIRESMVVGRKRVANYTYTRTDDRGNYRLGPLAGGTYYLVALGHPWFAQPQFQPAANPNAAIAPQPAYVPAFYPNSADPRGAAPLVLKAGAHVEANFTLTIVTGSTVKPVCANNKTDAADFIQLPKAQTPEQEQGQQEIMAKLRERLAANANRCNGQVNLYLHTVGDAETVLPNYGYGSNGTLTGVPPGRYTVRYNAPPAGAMRKIIDVSGAEITVDLNALPLPSVSGTVALKDPAMKPKSQMYVRLVNESTGAALARAVEHDGAFAWKTIVPAKYRVQVSIASPFLLDRLKVTGANADNDVIDITGGESVELQIVATNESGRLKGFVMNGDKPVMAALVVLVPRAPHDLGDYRGFQTESDGSFDFQNVRAGDYAIFALENPELEYANPAAIQPYLAQAKPVHINAHETGTERVELAAPLK